MFPLAPNDIVFGENFKIENAWNPVEPFEINKVSLEFKEAVNQLFEISGFPEPFLKGEKSFYNRWQKSHISLITTEEIRDLTKIFDITRVQMLSLLLPERVGSPISIKNLSDTLEVAHQTVKLWLNALENVYLIFQIPPYSERVQRSIKKEKKIYFWDWGIIEDKGKRFENFLAVQLYRTLSAWNEWGWGDFELFYIRTKDGRETDFLITNNKKPFILIESKFKNTNLDKNLAYFHKKLAPEYSFQIVFHDNYYKQISSNIFIMDIATFLKILV
jgi:predicted AAA+ superfamily ATPase